MSTPQPGRPSVEDVARWIRARTKDDGGHEIGTFDDTTRPTDDQVNEQIDVSMALIGLRTAPVAELPTDLQAAFAAVVSLDTACEIEKGYWPEQVRTSRSNYEVLKAERDEELAALEQAASAAMGGDEYRGGGYSMIPVGSWTSIGMESCPDPEAA